VRSSGPATSETADRPSTDAVASRPPTGPLRAVLWALVLVMTAAWLLLGGGLAALRDTVAPAPPRTGAEVGRIAPELSLPVAGGGEVSLAQLKGSVVLVNFWATWCAPCLAEMPAIERAYQAHRERGLAVLAVDVQEQDADVIRFLDSLGVTFGSAIDRTGDASRRFRANALPTTFLIDRRGIVRDVRVGPLTDQMLEERLARFLND
jgi:cytochrome c biogenesis protein CcmG, thiol:disulfide interchange protein DsbE